MTETAIMDEQAIRRAIARISYEIIEHNKGTENLCVVGILTRGVELAKRIAKKIQEVENRPVAVGQLDITTFRDDKKGTDPGCDSSQLDFSIENQSVVLVDDVIYTGRSVRAAIDALMARGRPRKIELAVLVDRGHRELPIRPDYVGKNVPTSRFEKIRVSVTPYDGVDRVTIVKDGD